MKKTLYGLRRSPQHWYKLASSALQEVGLTPCPHEPCLFTGNPIPGRPPLYLALYVDDFVYFSADKDVERQFELDLQSKLVVDFMGDTEWFLGIKFDWTYRPNGSVDCFLSQAAYTESIVESMNLTMANTSPKMTPYRSGLPIDAIPHQEMSDEKREKLRSIYRSYIGQLVWLSTSTRPDISTAISLLSTYISCPSQGHIDAARHVGKYLKATADFGICFSTDGNQDLEAFVHFPLQNTKNDFVNPIAFCDANWGPQDASTPGPKNAREVSTIRNKILYWIPYHHVWWPHSLEG